MTRHKVQSPLPTDVLCEPEQHAVNTPNHAAIRGITNSLGSNNCFLNCAVQGIWNLDPFRAAFVLIEKHVCTDKSCIFCSLLILAAYYQYHEQGPISPDILRNALAQAYQTDNRFQIGSMEDAAECLESILGTLHTSLSDCSPDTLCTAQTCISHRLFSMTLIEQDKCRCGANSEPLTFDQFIYYVAVSTLVSAHSTDNSLTFGSLLEIAAASSRPCPSESERCSGTAKLEVSMIEKPEVFCVGMAWTVTGDNSLVVKQLSDCIEVDLDLDEVFANVSASANNVYKLVGIMAYYGMHYFTFFFHSGVEKWLLYDDATVSEVGKSWDSVRKMLVKGKYQPLVLLYVNPKPEKRIKSSKNVLTQAFNSLKSHREKQKTKQMLAKQLQAESSGKCDATKETPSAPPFELKPPERLQSPPQSESTATIPIPNTGTSQTSTTDTSPVNITQSKRLLDDMVTGVGEKVSAGISLLGLKDVDSNQKNKFINDCISQADSQYYEARKALNTKEYTKALDLTIDATQLYKYILTHPDASFAQREMAQVRYNTARIRAKRVARRIPTAHLTSTQLSALYHKCPLCGKLREDEMQLCYDCTPYCKSCSKTISLSEGDLCTQCLSNLDESELETSESKRESRVKNGSEFSDIGTASPPPYETLQKTNCRICRKFIITTGGDLCHSCISLRESDF